MKQNISLTTRVRKQAGQLEKPPARPAVGPRKVQQIPFAKRVRETAQKENERDVKDLEVLSQRLPAFFQGVAALTGLRSQRENIECWSRWEEKLYEEQYGFGVMNKGESKNFHCWLFWGGLDLTEGEDAELFTHILLEPMYFLEQYADKQRGDLT